MASNVTPARRRGPRIARRAGVLGLLLLMAGCAANNGTGGIGGTSNANSVDPMRAEESDDIYEIVNFWASEPWISESGHVVGFRVSTRFVSSATNKGAFVPGRIFIWLYGFEPNFDGQVTRKLLHVWDMDRTEAMGWRITKRTRTGLAYWFLMRWPDELQLEGKRIEVEIGYERTHDKRLIMGSTRTMIVRASGVPRLQTATSRPQPAKQN